MSIANHAISRNASSHQAANHVVSPNASSHQTVDHALSRRRRYQVSKRNSIAATAKRGAIFTLSTTRNFNFQLGNEHGK